MATDPQLSMKYRNPKAQFMSVNSTPPPWKVVRDTYVPTPPSPQPAYQQMDMFDGTAAAQRYLQKKMLQKGLAQTLQKIAGGALGGIGAIIGELGNPSETSTSADLPAHMMHPQQQPQMQPQAPMYPQQQVQSYPQAQPRYAAQPNSGEMAAMGRYGDRAEQERQQRLAEWEFERRMREAQTLNY